MNDMADDQFLSTNGLFYRMPPTLSTTVDRTFNREQANKSSYTQGETIVIDLNIGTSYLDPKNAMLSFDLTVTATAGADNADRVTFGSGSAANLIKEIRFLSKNGCEVDRTTKSNKLTKIQQDYMYSVEGQRYLQMAGIGRVLGGAAGLAANKQRFVIPMAFISGFFRPVVKGMKMPGGLMSGMRIELTLEDPTLCFQRTAGTATALSYTIEDPTMLMMLHELNDPTQAVLLQNSSDTGLEYTFPSYFESGGESTQIRVNDQVKKAVGNCNKIFVAVYDLAGDNNILTITNDPVAACNSTSFAEFQFRVGANYYPQQTIKSDIEAWYIATSAFKGGETAVTLADYQSGGKFLLSHPLEADSALNLSGIPLNNSNLAAYQIAMTTSINREYAVFIEFITVAKTFINKTSIKI